VDNPQPRLPVQSVTEFISTYYPEFNVHIAFSVAKSVNKRFQFWYDNRHRYPDPRTRVPPFNDGIWPDKYDVHVSPEIFTSILHKQPISVDIPLPVPLGKYTTEHVEHAWSRDGTRLHNEIERFLNRVPSIPPCAKEWKRFMEFLHHNGDQQWWRTEFRMGCPDWHICGSTDAIAIGPDGEYVLWDWKRSGKLKADASQDVIYDRDKKMNAPFGYIPATDRNKYYFQLNIYKMILKKRYNIHIAAMYLMVIHPTLDRYLKIAVPDFETRHPKTYTLLKQELDKRAITNVGVDTGANSKCGCTTRGEAEQVLSGGSAPSLKTTYVSHSHHKFDQGWIRNCWNR
jgi:hypothetical protein